MSGVLLYVNAPWCVIMEDRSSEQLSYTGGEKWAEMRREVRTERVALDMGVFMYRTSNPS